MKIAVIHGNMRHGSTYNCVNILKEELETYSNNEVTEFFLPKDMPHFCNGCFNCFMKGENICPHYESMRPIVETLEEADVIILASPVYCFDVSGQMKTFLDHLGYMWLMHRPKASMFNKVGVVVTTAAGGGLSHTAKTMQYSLKFWGLKRVFTYKKPVAAASWEGISQKKQQKIRKEVSALASKISYCNRKIERFSTPIFTKMFFSIMRKVMKKSPWNQYDSDYWKKQGWLEKKSPF